MGGTCSSSRSWQNLEASRIFQSCSHAREHLQEFQNRITSLAVCFRLPLGESVVTERTVCYLPEPGVGQKSN